MGRNIARVYLRAESSVILYSRRRTTLDAARRAIGSQPAGELKLTTSIEEAAEEADIILESVPEALELKHDVLRRAEQANSKRAVIGTNTSSLPLEQLGRVLEFPERFLGVHWFNPAHLIPLVEVVPTEQTDTSVVQKIADHLSKVGKQPLVLRRAVPGFVANRLQYALIREALQLVEEGVADPEQIDLALTECLGLRWAIVGPMRTTDLAGANTAIAVAQELYPKLAANTSPQRVLLEIGARGGGFYECDDAEAIARERDEGLARILEARHRRSTLKEEE
jgi:3-hydroxybutyryl-CoA dehydrogenase